MTTHSAAPPPLVAAALHPAWRDRIVGLERIPASALRDHPQNWRLHPATQQTALAGVLAEIGQAAALLVYQSAKHGGLCVIDGHLRKALDEAATWPCLVLDVTDAEADLLLATLDPLAAMARRDEAALAALLGGLHADNQAVQALLQGLAEADRAGSRTAGVGIHPANAQAGVEELARLHSRWHTASGQLWACGVHRVYCGDATDEESYRAVCEGAEVHAVVTDPPYGVGVEYEGFEDTLENVEALIPGFMALLTRYPVVAVTSGTYAMWSYPTPTWLMAWVHPSSMSQGPWGFNGLNPILVYGKDPYLKAGMGSRNDHIVMVDDRGGESLHPCPKPLKVWTWLIERVTTLPAQTILDPFLGSGTSLIAAAQCHRRCFGIELDPTYVAVTLDRWERTTGETPTLLAG